MAKQIVTVVTNCNNCPNRDHEGGFGQIANVPYCSQAKKTIPYTVSIGPRNRAYASAKSEIPNWCPLEDHPTESPLQS